ncbi:MAG TPA: hypothetical protein VHN16_14935 [Streptosporangiaceae bacterium]|nr:hypothetical protein [Streptosporangiaceae bacterium]
MVPGAAPQVEVVPDGTPEAGVALDGTPEARVALDGTPEAGVVLGGTPEIDGSPVRGSPEWRQLSFRASGLMIELEITGVGDGRRLTGQLRPRQPAVVHIRHADGMISVGADALGRFSTESVPLGQISLRCRLGPDTDQSPVTTGWITI